MVAVTLAKQRRQEREQAAKRAKQIVDQDHRDTSLLKHMTKRSRIAWLQYVNGVIAAHSTMRTSDPDHGASNALAWTADLMREIHASHPKKGTFDGNMRQAAIAALVFALWYSRVQRAKAYDPRRPVVLRRAALATWRKFWHAMFDAAVYEGEDAEVFSGQHWDPPWSPHAVDGVFH